MVLTTTRGITHACRIALAVLVHANTLLAQQSGSPSLARLGEARPLLYGFALECVDCAPGGRGRVGGAGSGTGRGEAPVVWSYRSFPRVAGVAPGSGAEQAGIQPGDVLISIDGLSLLNEQGASRFARAVKGDEVRLVFERDSKPISVSLVLGAVVGSRGGPVRIGTGYVAFRGPIHGEMSVEIWSDEPIFFPPDSGNAPGVAVLRIGTNTVIKLRLVKDSTDSTGGRSGAAKKPELDR